MLQHGKTDIFDNLGNWLVFLARLQSRITEDAIKLWWYDTETNKVTPNNTLELYTLGFPKQNMNVDQLDYANEGCTVIRIRYFTPDARVQVFDYFGRIPGRN